MRCCVLLHLIWVYTVCSGLSVRIHIVNTVKHILKCVRQIAKIFQANCIVNSKGLERAVWWTVKILSKLYSEKQISWASCMRNSKDIEQIVWQIAEILSKVLQIGKILSKVLQRAKILSKVLQRAELLSKLYGECQRFWAVCMTSSEEQRSWANCMEVQSGLHNDWWVLLFFPCSQSSLIWFSGNFNYQLMYYNDDLNNMLKI